MSDDGGSGWVGCLADEHGRPKRTGNDHLTAEQPALLEEQAQRRGRERGRHQAVVVVNVYENGEAVPQVQFPAESTLDMNDASQVSEAVARAAESLLNWS